MDERFFQVILACIPVIGAVITGFLVPWLRTKIGNEKLTEYMAWARALVESAEQIFTKDQWQEKKKFCVDFLTRKYGTILTVEQIDILIEAAVKELRLAEKGVE